jgi:hypothetical protein
MVYSAGYQSHTYRGGTPAARPAPGFAITRLGQDTTRRLMSTDSNLG